MTQQKLLLCIKSALVNILPSFSKKVRRGVFIGWFTRHTFVPTEQEGHGTRTRSAFENELNENKVQEIGTKLAFKGLCYIYKESVFSFYCEIDIERNLHFCPQFSQIVPYSRLTLSRTRISFSLCHTPCFRNYQRFSSQMGIDMLSYVHSSENACGGDIVIVASFAPNTTN